MSCLRRHVKSTLTEKESRQLAPSALAKKLYEKKIYFLLFLPALFGDHVGCAKTHEDDDAAANRCILVSF